MLRDLLEVWHIIKAARKDGYDGDFAVIPETVMEDIQVTYGRAIAENVIYQKIIKDLVDGKDICPYCEDYEECENETGKCQAFMLRFPDNKEAKEAFNECYEYYEDCEGRSDG